MTTGEQKAGEPKAGEHPRLVVRDGAMLGVLRRIEQVAASRAPVLITGESGTGKNLVAAHLHRCSGDGGGPFIVLNCAAIPEPVLDAELFGHDEAACTDGCTQGGTQGRSQTGKFAAARGGTLLLDGIGEMDLHTQAMVLRAISKHETDGAGSLGPGGRQDGQSVRIVAITNRVMTEEVRHGRFRSDLFFRLNVVAITLPALRDRPADIPALADHFAQLFAADNGLAPLDISPAALDALLLHPWPGNVRELANVMHRAVLTATGGAIAPSDLGIDQPLSPAFPNSLAFPDGPVAAVNTSGRTIEAVEKDMILDTLYRCKGNRGETARVLGIAIRTLRNKLNEYERTGTRIPRPVIVAVA